MVGNAHIDPMWIWSWDEGMHEVLQTFRAAADRLDEDPDLTFTASSASYYRWAMETSPELFARIRVLVADGRWIVTGGQWVEPDCNLPAGESVCRQLLYGQRFLSEHLGVTARIGYNVDSFGHAGTLPQLLAASGIGAYVFMRPGPDEKALPSPAFRWRGTDGTELPAYRIPIDYSTPSWAEEETLRTRTAELLDSSADLGIPLMGFFGVGDHGGGRPAWPSRPCTRSRPSTRAPSPSGTPPRTSRTWKARRAADALPVVDGELQWHAVGCYSVDADLKLANAGAEDALVAAEAFTEMCRLLTGDAPDVRHELAAAWEGVLFAQFHDALGGTCTDGATEAVRALLVSGAARAEQVAVRALHRVAEQVDTWVEGAEAGESIESAFTGLPVPMMVFNPHSWPVTGSVSLPHPIAVATDAEGRRVAVQQVASGEVTYSPTRGLLQVTVPPLGYRRYWLHVVDPDPGAPGEAPIRRRRRRRGPHERPPAPAGGPGDRRLASAVSIGGDIDAGHRAAGGRCPPGPGSRRQRHLVARRRLLRRTRGGRGGSCRSGGRARPGARPPCAACGRSATAGRRSPRTSPSSPAAAVRECPSTSTGTKSTACSSSSSRWHWSSPSSTAGAPYGSVGRPCSGHEEPMVHWVDLSGASAGWGLACVTEGAGGYDAQGATLRLTVLRSPRVADHGRGWGAGDAAGYPLTDQGRHRVRYALVPHAGPAAGADLPRHAAEHRASLPVVLDTWHRGRLGPEGSALRLEGAGGPHAGPQAGRGRRWHGGTAVGGRGLAPPCPVVAGSHCGGVAVRLGGRAAAPRGAHRLRARRGPRGSRTVDVPSSPCGPGPGPTSRVSCRATPSSPPSAPTSRRRSRS